jgi:hypothetical protein
MLKCASGAESISKVKNMHDMLFAILHKWLVFHDQVSVTFLQMSQSEEIKAGGCLNIFLNARRVQTDIL